MKESEETRIWTPGEAEVDRAISRIADLRLQRLGDAAVEEGVISPEEKDRFLRAAADCDRFVQALLEEKKCDTRQLGELMEAVKRHDLNLLLSSRRESVPPEVLKRQEVPENCWDQFVLVEKVGKGGMGEVWKAWDRDIHRWVALKILQLENDQAVRRFVQEAELAGRLSHPNIVSIFGTGRKKGSHYIAMQFIFGAVPAVVPNRAKNNARIIRDAARAVHFSHQNGVIHRDLKPANLMLDHRGHLFVLDFGLARPGEFAQGITVSGGLLGTPAYMSPEQARGDMKNVSASSDIFSLGATLYELCCGVPPYKGGSSGEILADAVQGDFPYPRAVNSKIHPELEAILLMAMAKEPENRYQTANDFADDLEKWIEGDPIVARSPSVRKRFVRAVRKKPLRFTLAALFLVAISTVLVIGGLRYRQAVRLGEEGMKLSRKGELEEAQSRLSASLALWEMESHRRELELVREELGLRNRAAELGRQYDLVYRKLGAEIHRAEEVGHGGVPPSPEEREAILKKVEEVLSAIPSPWNESSLPHAFRGWIECNLGLVEPGKKNLERAVALGGLKKGDPYGLIFLARWSARESYNTLQPVLFTVEGLGDWSSKPATELLPRFRELEDELARASRMDEGTPVLQLLRAIVQMLRGEYAEAADSLMELSGSREVGAEAVWLAGVAWYLADRPEKSVRCHETASRLAPRWVSIWGWLGLLYMGAGKDQTETKREMYETSLQSFQQALFLNPKHADTLTNRGRLYQRLGALETDEKKAEKWISLALQDYNSALEQEPERGEMYVNRGVVHLKLSNIQRALSDFNKALKLRPGMNPALVNRGAAYTRLGDVGGAKELIPSRCYRLAIADYDRVLSQGFQPAALAYNNRGFAWLQLGRRPGGDPEKCFGKAIEDTTKSITLAPEFALAWHDRGKARLHLGQFRTLQEIDARQLLEKAVGDFDRALALKPQSADTHLERGMTHDFLGRIETVLRIDPTEHRRKALEDYKAAISLDPRYWQANSNLGELLEILGRLEEALASYEAAYKIVGDRHPPLKESMERVRGKLREEKRD